jgi:hypothetical protein
MTTNPMGGSLQDLVSTQKSGVNYLGQILTLFQSLFPRITGTFTMNAATSTAVADTRVQAGFTVVGFASQNAAAGTLLGSAKSLYVSAVNPGVGFTVTTANATSAAGTEKFSYYGVNPV